MTGEPATCEIRNWLVFEVGNWKGEYYGPERVARIKQSFDELRGVIKPPVLKLGHTNDQELRKRLQESIGFPAFGHVQDLGLTPKSQIEVVKLVEVPVEIGGAINAGQFRGGSVELVPFIQDPRDASKRIDGPVLRAIALLGEEADALPHLPPPKAYFADGRLVPAKPLVGALIQAMAEVTKSFSLGYRPPGGIERIGQHDYPVQVLCYSEFTPMPLEPGKSRQAVGHNIETEQEHGKPHKQAVAIALDEAGLSKKNHSQGAVMSRDELIAKLLEKGIDVAADPQLMAAPDETLKEMLDGALGGNFAAYSAAMKKCYSGGVKMGNDTAPKGQLDEGVKKPEATQADEAPKWFSDAMEGVNKRLGAVEKFADASQKDKTEEESKEYSAFAMEVVDSCIAPAKGMRPTLLRRDRDLYIRQGVEVCSTAKFGEVAGREAAKAAWAKDLRNRPPVFPEKIPNTNGHAVPETQPMDGVLAGLIRGATRVGGRLDRDTPTVTKTLREKLAKAGSN